MLGIVIGILVLSLLMVLHELGHYLAGRALRFTIEEFSIFMGPKLVTWKRKGIQYSIRALPIGAFVRFAGEETRDAENPDPGQFFRRPRWARAAVISAGPVVNIVAGFCALLVLYSITGYGLTTVTAPAADSQAAAAGLSAGDRILSVDGSPVWSTMDFVIEDQFLANTKTLTVVVRPADGSPDRTVDLVPVKSTGYRLGITVQPTPAADGIRIVTVDATSNGGHPVLQKDDVIISIDGVATTTMDAISAAVKAAGADRDLTIVVSRAGVATTLTMRAASYEFVNARGISFGYGHTFPGAVGAAFTNGASAIRLTFRSISMLITGAIKPQDGLSGPVGIVDTIGIVVSQGQSAAEVALMVLWIFALISLNLGIFNLLPIPALDGSQLILIGVEAARGGKRLPERVENVIVTVGFCFIIGLAIVGLVFDILRIVNR